MGFPKFQWCKGHGLPWSGMGHYGLREKDIYTEKIIANIHMSALFMKT